MTYTVQVEALDGPLSWMWWTNEILHTYVPPPSCGLTRIADQTVQRSPMGSTRSGYWCTNLAYWFNEGKPRGKSSK